MTVETITEAFIKFLESKGVATFGQDLFLKRVPSSLKTEDDIFWIKTSGGDIIRKLSTGEKVKQYVLYLYFRSTKSEVVEKRLFALEELLNCTRCVELQGFETIDISASQFQSDEDTDLEDREVGMLQINIQTYKKEC